MNQEIKIIPQSIIEIPRLNSSEQFEKNQDKAYMNNKEHCPCCGKQINNAKYFINSIYGGSMYPKNDKREFSDAWVMGVGSECRKKLPKEYIMTKKEL